MTAFGFYFLTALVALGFIVLSFYLIFSAEMSTFGTYLLIIPLLALVVAFGKWLIVRSTLYELTNERLRVASGLLSRSTEEIELYRVRDYSIHQPLMLRIAGQGNIRVVASDATAPSFAMEGIVKPQELLDRLRKLTEAAREAKSVRHVDVE